MPPQRWRLTLRRDSVSDVAQRDLQQAWDTTLRDAGLVPWPPDWVDSLLAAAPGAASSGPRLTQPKVVVAAPLPFRMSADRELVDLYLPQPILLHEVRGRLAPALPPGHDLVDIYDVWFGAPALPGMVVAADYVVAVSPSTAEAAVDPNPLRVHTNPANPDDVSGAIDAILAAANVPRGRIAEGRGPVNLRPLIIAIRYMNGHMQGRSEPAAGHARVAEPDLRATELWMRLRLDSSVGSGRPDDVVDAIAARTGRPMTIVRQHRERLWLRDDAGGPVPASTTKPSGAAPAQASAVRWARERQRSSPPGASGRPRQ